MSTKKKNNYGYESVTLFLYVVTFTHEEFRKVSILVLWQDSVILLKIRFSATAATKMKKKVKNIFIVSTFPETKKP